VLRSIVPLGIYHRRHVGTAVHRFTCARDLEASAVQPALRLFIAAFVIAPCVPSAAGAHGIAGNRFFVGTLTFDDPSVANEAIVPNFSTLNRPAEGANAIDNRSDWSFTRLLTPVLQVQVDGAWIRRNWPTGQTSGFATTDVGVKSEIYRNNQHEMLVSAGCSWASAI
jgi:hypothetical protein